MPNHPEPVATVSPEAAIEYALAAALMLPDGVKLCAAGHHAWVPWLRLYNGSWVTWCAREGCDHHEQYDDMGVS